MSKSTQRVHSWKISYFLHNFFNIADIFVLFSAKCRFFWVRNPMQPSDYGFKKSKMCFLWILSLVAREYFLLLWEYFSLTMSYIYCQIGLLFYLDTYTSPNVRECKLTSLTFHTITRQFIYAMGSLATNCRWKLFFDWVNGKTCQLIFPYIWRCISINVK